MGKKKGTTIKGRGLWDFDTTPPTQIMTDQELANYKRDGLPIPTYALDIPDDEIYTSMQTKPQLTATSTSSFMAPTQLPNLRINPDMYFLNPIPLAERRTMALERELRNLESEVRELREKSNTMRKKKKSTPKKKRSVSKKKKRRTKSK